MSDTAFKGQSPYKYLFLTLILILVDQAIKLWMYYDVLPNHYGEIDIIPNVFKLHYVENKGMAFGMELGGEYGKLILTTFRLGAMVGICWYLVYLTKRNAHAGLLWSIAAVLGGAIGNVIDSTFYGVWLDNAPAGVSTPWFHGQVIDMFYAYGLDGQYPDWIPFLGGDYNTTPIFNFADACIFCGVVSILVFQQKFFEHDHSAKSYASTTNQPIEEVKEESAEAIRENLEAEETLNEELNQEVAEIVAEDQQYRLTEEPKNDISEDNAETPNQNQ
ncbi:Lipoprotein signal peptidase [Emticicia oligotrophica DSM 17448]|uniref:Lipoprotein signal peptidase n=1 Tax=Emticicia oligotrophica (strain DSM 17448 / CIP 109782 / MTCC 6937 / GPTSA100-15) TaxID=929562 RepID=A0ABN4AR99_EMTOG|nr:lipoprotein signal peptidase [Emticicia oligotrophica]AFK04421.1 Lipoprotein signal peptidase [Emticicia oligotrophica DSM 17448]